MEEHIDDMVLLKLRNTPKNARYVNCLLYYAHQELLDNINNWRAATAGTTNASTTSGNASGSVCPKGWTLPSGRSSGDYKELVDRYYIKDDSASNTKLQKAPLSFVISGRYYYSTGSLSDDSSWGIYWSRTATNSTTTYALRFGSVGINPSLFGYRGDGNALRCVAR